MKIKLNDKVMFSQAVVKRLGHDARAANMRGVIVEIRDRIARVDCGDTYISEEGNRVRSIPLANLALARIESFLD